VNFIGHAAVALWQRADPAFVLGSMLPDFAGMAGLRMAHASADADPDLAAGVALHHRTDEVFHSAPAFVALQQRTLDALTPLGIPRGTARAVGHIGVEMLIDGELLADRELADAYVRALASDVALAGVFPNDEALAKLAHLRTRLTDHGVPYDYRDPDAVLRRLQFVLARRPRLAIAEQSAPHVRQLLPSLQRDVREALPALLASVRQGLDARLG
jgi:acyl carrier protein phosphodiesterase